MKKSRIFVLALVGFAVLFVSAAVAAPFAEGDTTGPSDMMKDGTFHHGACDDKHLPSRRREEPELPFRKRQQ